MKKENFALAGLAFGGIGVFLGITMSSAVPQTPFIYGTAIAVYAGVAAAVVGGTRKRNGNRSRE